jgi:hypothetical protein
MESVKPIALVNQKLVVYQRMQQKTGQKCFVERFVK